VSTEVFYLDAKTDSPNGARDCSCLVVELVAFRRFGRLGLRILGGMGLAGAWARRPWLVARILALLVGVGPLGVIRIVDRVCERVVRLVIPRAIARISVLRLGRPGPRRPLVILIKSHRSSPVPGARAFMRRRSRHYAVEPNRP
jgi:hypothetical protein